MEAEDRGLDAEKLEREDSVTCLRSRHPTAVHEILNLVIPVCVSGVGGNSHSRTVVALVNVLVQIFDGTDGGTYLLVNVAVVLEREGGVVRNDPAVVYRNGPRLRNESSIVFSPALDRMGVYARQRLGLEFFRELFFALAVHHAGRLGILCTTWVVDHVF